MGNSPLCLPNISFPCEISPIPQHNFLCKTSGNSNKSTVLSLSLINNERPQMPHLSFDEFESIFSSFKSNLLKKTLKNAHNSPNFSCFFDVYSRHFALKGAELNLFYHVFNGISDDLLDEFHYSSQSIVSMSPAKKHFRNLSVKSHVFLNDELILNYFNVIKEDFEDENNVICKLIQDLSKVFHEKLQKFVLDFSAKNLAKLQKNEFLSLKNWVFSVIKNILIIPIKEIIMFLYDKMLVNETLMSSTLEEMVYSLSESIVFQKKYGFYETFQNILFFENHDNRKNLRENRFLLKEFDDLSNEIYEISQEFKGNNEEYREIINILMSFSKRRTSSEKVKILYEIHREIPNLLKRINKEKRDFWLKDQINADNLLPFFIYLIHQAKNCNLHQEILFCESFARENLEEDYLFCIFKSALEYVTITV